MLLLLSEIRRKLLWAWLILAAPVLLLLTIQELNTVFEGTNGAPWVWATINLLPGFAMLLLGAILNTNPGKHIWRPVFRIILVITSAYLLWVLLTALGLRARPETQSIVDYYRQAWYRPAMFQVLLLVVYGLLFFRRETVFVPNTQIVSEHVSKALKKAKKAGNAPQSSALELFSLAKYGELFTLMQNHFNTTNRSAMNDLALLQNQYTENRRQLNLGVADPKAAQRELNRISLALLNLIEKM